MVHALAHGFDPCLLMVVGVVVGLIWFAIVAGNVIAVVGNAILARRAKRRRGFWVLPPDYRRS